MDYSIAFLLTWSLIPWILAARRFMISSSAGPNIAGSDLVVGVIIIIFFYSIKKYIEIHISHNTLIIITEQPKKRNGFFFFHSL